MISGFCNFLTWKSQTIHEFWLWLRFQYFILVYHGHQRLQRSPIPYQYSSTKQTLLGKGNLWIQKRQYILKFTLHVFSCPEFIFLSIKATFCLKSKLFLFKVRFSIYNTLDFNERKWNEEEKQYSGAFSPPRKKNIVLIVRASFPFFNTYLKNKIKLFVLNQIMMTEYRAEFFITCFVTETLW